MRVDGAVFKKILYGLLITGQAYLSLVEADELPSMAFLEYLAEEESRVDEQWTGPVDLDIEQYLVANQPKAKKSGNSEDDKHE